MKSFICEKVLVPIIVPVLRIVLSLTARKMKEPKDAGAYKLDLPEIYDTITTAHALELCTRFKFDALSKRIVINHDQYQDWQFDGVSMAPDCLVSLLIRSPNITKIALKHDLKYAYGKSGYAREKKAADLKLRKEIIADGGHKWMAKLLFCLVDAFGKEEYGFDFSWCFAHKEKKLLK